MNSAYSPCNWASAGWPKVVFAMPCKPNRHCSTSCRSTSFYNRILTDHCTQRPKYARASSHSLPIETVEAASYAPSRDGDIVKHLETTPSLIFEFPIIPHFMIGVAYLFLELGTCRHVKGWWLVVCQRLESLGESRSNALYDLRRIFVSVAYLLLFESNWARFERVLFSHDCGSGDGER